MRLVSASALFHCWTRRSLSCLNSSSCDCSRIITPNQTKPLRLDLTLGFVVVIHPVILEVDRGFFDHCLSLISFRLMAVNTWNTHFHIADLFIKKKSIISTYFRLGCVWGSGQSKKLKCKNIIFTCSARSVILIFLIVLKDATCLLLFHLCFMCLHLPQYKPFLPLPSFRLIIFRLLCSNNYSTLWAGSSGFGLEGLAI